MKSLTLPLLSALLILVQAGLAVGHCHEVQCGSPNQGTRHVHVDHLLDWDNPADEEEHDSPCHDEWTVNDTGPMVLEASHTGTNRDLSSTLAGFEISPEMPSNRLVTRSPHPPPWREPSRALYLTFCTLRN